MRVMLCDYIFTYHWIQTYTCPGIEAHWLTLNMSSRSMRVRMSCPPVSGDIPLSVSICSLSPRINHSVARNNAV